MLINSAPTQCASPAVASAFSYTCRTVRREACAALCVGSSFEQLMLVAPFLTVKNLHQQPGCPLGGLWGDACPGTR